MKKETIMKHLALIFFVLRAACLPAQTIDDFGKMR
jgi:hypothetical protein